MELRFIGFVLRYDANTKFACLEKIILLESVSKKGTENVPYLIVSMNP